MQRCGGILGVRNFNVVYTIRFQNDGAMALLLMPVPLSSEGNWAMVTSGGLLLPSGELDTRVDMTLWKFNMGGPAYGRTAPSLKPAPTPRSGPSSFASCSSIAPCDTGDLCSPLSRMMRSLPMQAAMKAAEAHHYNYGWRTTRLAF